MKIVESRLEGIQAFRREAIEFAARKVGAVSGDARRALDICRYETIGRRAAADVVVLVVRGLSLLAAFHPFPF